MACRAEDEAEVDKDEVEVRRFLVTHLRCLSFTGDTQEEQEQALGSNEFRYKVGIDNSRHFVDQATIQDYEVSEEPDSYHVFMGENGLVSMFGVNAEKVSKAPVVPVRPCFLHVGFGRRDPYGQHTL